MQKISINLISDHESGEGGISINESFENQSYLFQIEVLKDWIKLLQIEYADRWDLWASQMESLDPGPIRTDRRSGPERTNELTN